jgi:hypothetical protein
MQPELTYKGEVYRIKFTHKRNKLCGMIDAKGGTTIAFITDKIEGGVIATGRAECSNKDTYSKRFGRRIAIGRLKQALGLSTKG